MTLLDYHGDLADRIAAHIPEHRQPDVIYFNVTEDTVMHGKPLSRGQQVVLLLGGGNRDPQAFENADQLDVTRENVRHLSFGHGLHHCIGSQLAKLEGSLALDALITRFPNLREGGEIQWGTNTVLRGPSRLPLRV